MDSDRPSISNNAIVRHIKSATIHENFDAHSFDNDIAIIEMDQPVSINNFVRAACLPEDGKLFLILVKYIYISFKETFHSLKLCYKLIITIISFFVLYITHMCYIIVIILQL